MVNVGDAELVGERRRERVERIERGVLVFIKFAVACVFGIPIVVVLFFYFFGWKAAVAVFPLLFLTLQFFQRARHFQHDLAQSRNYFKNAARISVCLIPVISIATSKPEIMRLWALGVGAVLAASVLNTKIMVRNQATKDGAISSVNSKVPTVFSAAPGILFIAISELIWLYGTLSLWIWYHAFFFQICLVLVGLAVWFRRITGGTASSQRESVKQGISPNIAAQPQGQCHRVLIRLLNGSWLEYKCLTFEQAKELYRSFCSDTSFGDAGLTGTDLSGQLSRVFKVDFDAYTHLVVTEAQFTQSLEWQYTIETTRWLQMPPLKVLRAAQVPAALITDLFEAGWREEWGGIETLLVRFAATGGNEG